MRSAWLFSTAMRASTCAKVGRGAAALGAATRPVMPPASARTTAELSRRAQETARREVVATRAALLFLARLPGELTGSGGKVALRRLPRDEADRRFTPRTWVPGSGRSRTDHDSAVSCAVARLATRGRPIAGHTTHPVL